MNRRTLFKAFGLGALGIYMRLAPHVVKAAEVQDQRPIDRIERYDDGMRACGPDMQMYRGRLITNQQAIDIVTKRSVGHTRLNNMHVAD